ncbi:MAG: hypothetical protein WD156_12595 [Acidimicrobiia bacterium]
MVTKSFVIALVAAAALGPGAAESACPMLDLVQGSSLSQVRGVVERTPVASNPLPWGSSISAVTRVWGGVLVERWAAEGEIDRCLVPAENPTYEAIGIDETLEPASGVLSGLEHAALTSQFGQPVVYEPSGFDRAMAWVRMFPSVPVVIVLVGWSVVALVRRRHRSDPYLF